MKKTFAMCLFLLAACGDNNCPPEMVQDYQAFSTSVTRNEDCVARAKGFSSHWGGKVCKIKQDEKASDVVADAVVIRALQECEMQEKAMKMFLPQ